MPVGAKKPRVRTPEQRLPRKIRDEFETLEGEGFDWAANKDGSADAMTRVPADAFLEWQELNDLSYLPSGFRIMTRIRIEPKPGLPEYLKSPKSTAYTLTGAQAIERADVPFQPRHPLAWRYLVSATLEAMSKLLKKGWTPQIVEVFVRWAPTEK